MTLELGVRNHIKLDDVEQMAECFNCPHEECINCHGNRAKREGKRNELKKPVDQLDLDGNYIRTWPSVSDAARAVGGNPQNISNCIRGRSTRAGKYRWRYATSVN